MAAENQDQEKAEYGPMLMGLGITLVAVFTVLGLAYWLARVLH